MSGQARLNKFKNRKLRPLKEQGTSEEGEEEGEKEEEEKEVEEEEKCLLNDWTD